jgi:hypothetical protein
LPATRVVTPLMSWPDHEEALSWSDHEEELFQQDRRRRHTLGALFAAFLILAAVALTIHGAGSGVAFAAALAALGGAALLGARWRLNGSVADAFGQVARERRAERKHRLYRRRQAIVRGAWQPPGTRR